MNVHVPYTQSGRMMAIATRLGPDVLLLDGLDVDEGVNGLFTIRATVKSQRDDLGAADLIGSSADFSLRLKDEGTRWWNGLVTELHEGPATSRSTRSYALTLRPKLWLLSQTSDCRIFQNTSTLDVVQTLCSENGITDLSLRVIGQPVQLDYSVQWNETDLDYMLRRMQQDGYFYYHVHAQGRHTLVVADHQSQYDPAPEPDVRLALGSPGEDHIGEWRRSFAFTPGKRSGRDWNFLSMSPPADTEVTLDPVPGNASAELYEYPGLFLDTGGAEAAMRARIQASETGYETVEAASTVRTLAPGRTFTPRDVARPDDVVAPQVVTGIRHALRDPTYETTGGRPSYTNSFTALPAATPATPHRTVPRPVIVGSQIALIAGPAGEEIYTEQYGRVKLQFPWDRRAKGDGSDTCWVRVGQPWAGGTWGYQVIPRVGMEALVSYQEGDPDRPFVTALVPDPTNKVPYTLPDNKTRMVVRSNSYKSTGYNEMTFEDATGGERIHTFGQKDATTFIGNNATRNVNQNAVDNVGANRSLQVGANMQQNVGGGLSIAVGAVGGAVPGLIGANLAGLMGQSSGLLGDAMGLVSGVMGGAAAAGLSGAPGGGALGAAQMAAGIVAPAASYGGADAASGGAVAAAMGYASALAGAGPALTAAGGAAEALAGVASDSSMKGDAGPGAGGGRRLDGPAGGGDDRPRHPEPGGGPDAEQLGRHRPDRADRPSQGAQRRAGLHAADRPPEDRPGGRPVHPAGRPAGQRVDADHEERRHHPAAGDGGVHRRQQPHPAADADARQQLRGRAVPTLVNHLPFPNFRYYSGDSEGRKFGIIVVKGTFEIGEDGRLTVAEEQAPMLFEDTCHGAVNETSLWHPSDLVPVKPRADVIVNAVARAPGGHPLPSWECGISVAGPEGVLVDKRLRVTGPRRWEPRWRLRLTEGERRDWRRYRPLFAGWALSEPEPVAEVPLRYELAYGGTIETGLDDAGKPRFDCDKRNPIGRGLIDPEWTDHTVAQPAPQIEALDEPVADPYRRHAPQGLGPIPPAWQPRLPKGGTYDQDWIDTVWPNWAKDYDFAYHNCAHPDLVCPRHLRPGDRVAFDNLVADRPRLTLTLPDLQPVAGLVTADGRAARRAMALDTLFLDIAGRRFDARVFLSWRTTFEPDRFTSAVLIERRDLDMVTAATERRAA